MFRKRAFSAGVLALFFAAALSSCAAQAAKDAVNREPAMQLQRGGIVFRSYCVLCHGERGQGPGRAAKLYANLDLSITPHPTEYYDRIIRMGGAAVDRSVYMPPWQDELSEEQIEDVITYLSIMGQSVRRGETVYKTNCILCHGVNGDGKGRAAVNIHPPPSDLIHSDKNDRHKMSIIRQRGTQLGRSAEMPPWEDQLTNDEILDLVDYLRSIKSSTPRP
jgi:cbb3-type cytochrome c oxidase subunit III